MKKHITVIAILLILSICTTVIFSGGLDATKNNTVITENVIFGDKALAEGVVVKQLAQYGYHLFWDTEYRIGAEPYINTEFSFSSSEKRNSTIVYNGLYVALRDGYGCDFKKPAEEQFGIAKAYKELFDDTAPGEEKSRVIRLTDYYKYYPVSPNVDIPKRCWTGIVYENLNGNYESEKAVHDRFTEFFRIPMLESEIVQISVGKDIYGNLTMTGSGNAYSDEENDSSDYYSPETVSAYTDSVCYFSFSNRTDKGNAVDTGMIEGGYGIYKFDFTGGKYKNENGVFTTGIDASSLSTCFPLSEEYSVCDMWVSDDGGMLYCILLDTSQNAFFIQIDTVDFKAITTIPLQNDVSKYGIYVYPYDTFTATVIEDKITVLSPSSDGVYEFCFCVPLSEYVSESFKWLCESAVMDYNGEKLIVAGNLPEKKYLTYQTCDFYIAIYSSSGLEFYAEYNNSLSVNSDSGSYKANCHPEKIQVSWN